MPLPKHGDFKPPNNHLFICVHIYKKQSKTVPVRSVRSFVNVGYFPKIKLK